MQIREISHDEGDLGSRPDDLDRLTGRPRQSLARPVGPSCGEQQLRLDGTHAGTDRRRGFGVTRRVEALEHRQPVPGPLAEQGRAGPLEHHVREETPQATLELTANIATVRKEYDAWALETVSKAFVAAFDEAAQSLLKKYLDMAEASLRQDRLRDPVTGDWIEPDERFLHSLEDLIGVSESGRRSFREELLVRVAGTLRRGEAFRYDSHPRMRAAIEKHLFADLQGLIRTTVSTKVPDEEQLRRLEEVRSRLVQNAGFCPHCSEALLRYVGYLLERTG